MNVNVRTCLWFNGTGEEAARFYVSLLPDSRIENVVKPKPNEAALIVNFTLAGIPYQALNGGSAFSLSEAVSISITTQNQADTDELWQALTADGGNESQCGWLKDRFGLSWQIVPQQLSELLADPNADTAGRVMQAMMQMKKINIAALQAAYRGENV